MIAAASLFVVALAADVPRAVPSPAVQAANPPPVDVSEPPRVAIRSPSGLAMRVLKRGAGQQHPKDNDCVRVHYTMWRRDGSFLSGTRQWGEPQNQCLGVAFAGVATALKAMVPGEQRRVWVPASQTYRGDDDDHPVPVDITVDLELLSINAAPPTPKFLKTPPPKVHKQPDGLAIEVLKKGTGEQHPLENSDVKLDFSGWTSDGRIIESSLMAHQPAVFPMGGVIKGWREALSQMVVGDKVRIWIPRDLAYGEKPRRGQPKGDLIYELELLAIK